MKSKRQIGLITVVLLLIVSIWLLQGPSSSDSSADGSPSSGSSDPKKKAGGTSQSDKKESTTPSIELPAVTEEDIPPGTIVSGTGEAQEVINDKSKELGLGEDSELIIDSNSSDEYGNTYYHAGQSYKGVPIYGASTVLEVEQGEATVISGSWVPEFELEIEPTFDAKTALRMGLDVLGVPEERSVQEQGEARLIIFPSDNGMKLCWLMQARLSNPISVSEIYIVDAQHPEILLRHEASLR